MYSFNNLICHWLIYIYVRRLAKRNPKKRINANTHSHMNDEYRNRRRREKYSLCKFHDGCEQDEREREQCRGKSEQE